jgi:hypothetical protein
VGRSPDASGGAEGGSRGSCRRRRRRSKSAATTAIILLATGLLTAPTSSSALATLADYNWYPGYYVLNNTDTAARKQLILDDPLVEPFTGVQFRYHWAASELGPGDYSAGFATLDADLERVAAKGKKLMVMLVYKKSDGTSAVPADLRTGPGPWCSGPYCGELTNGTGTSVALLWNPVVEARLNAWIAAMAQHLSESPYIDSVAGIVFSETSLGTTNTTVLASANYDPDVYIQALKDNMLAATTAAPRLITILYFEGGFVSMDGSSVKAGQKIGDWMLLNPRTGAGTPDLKPKDPKGPNHPCANPTYQSSIACAPAVQANDYSTAVTDSFDRSFHYATDPVPNGLHASFFTFSYAVGAGPNAFTFADVSNNIASYPIPNIARPWPVTPGNGPPVAADDTGTVARGGTLNQPAPGVLGNDTDPQSDPLAVITTPVALPTNGTLTLDADGSYTYIHDGSETVADSFVYQVCDPGPLCDTATVDLTITAPSSGLIFADGFESGDLFAWTSSTTDLGDLGVSGAATLVGSKGLQALIDDNTAIYVTDDTPTAEPRYRARFYFDPNSIPMASGDTHDIFYGYSGTSTDVLRVRFRFRNGNYQLRAALRNDRSTWTNTGWYTISDAPRAIELDWQAATAAGANNGGLTLWIGGVQQANLTGVDNDTRRIDRVGLGAVTGIDTGTRGTYYFDAFESRRQTYIGP